MASVSLQSLATIKENERDGDESNEPLLSNETSPNIGIEEILRPHKNHTDKSRGQYNGLQEETVDHKLDQRAKVKRRPSFSIVVLSLLILAATFIFGHVSCYRASEIHRIVRDWTRPGHAGQRLASYPTDFSRDIIPIPCHSHNDYWRKVPLFSAIEAGCISVEADVWLHEGELFVGHSVSSLTSNRTLASLYVESLLEILEKQNQPARIIPEENPSIRGVFDTDAEQSLVLLIDFKTNGSELWPYIVKALEPLRIKGYLSRLNDSRFIRGSVTVVGTGNTPFDKVISQESNPNHDVFFDAPLDKLSASATSSDGGLYNASNSYYASVDFASVFQKLENGKFSDADFAILRRQVQLAHSCGLRARYWNLPTWPIHVRNHVWDVVTREGVDVLNVDDLASAAGRDWLKIN